MSGQIRSVGCFTNGLKFLKVQKINIQAVVAGVSLEDAKERLVEIIQEWDKQSETKPKPVELQLGIAINPLKGIGVPFPYTSLRSRVTAFR
ncbi:hypothetical protein B9Z19DRAFT_1123641 [Tuber borchii]|uniref:Uncharacterized protein n=1 Tax=Tuber borchii TaxID=42251 RepID=A0A2T6ZY33_TUBBO|nr:hypothetical protein B9Z19DRAFT_1123641 [Tuber borchii]